MDEEGRGHPPLERLRPRPVDRRMRQVHAEHLVPEPGQVERVLAGAAADVQHATDDAPRLDQAQDGHPGVARCPRSGRPRRRCRRTSSRRDGRVDAVDAHAVSVTAEQQRQAGAHGSDRGSMTIAIVPCRAWPGTIRHKQAPGDDRTGGRRVVRPSLGSPGEHRADGGADRRRRVAPWGMVPEARSGTRGRGRPDGPRTAADQGPPGGAGDRPEVPGTPGGAGDARTRTSGARRSRAPDAGREDRRQKTR